MRVSNAYISLCWAIPGLDKSLCVTLYQFLSLNKYYRLSIYHSYISYDSAHNTTTLVRFGLMNDTPYLALTGELLGVFHEWYEEKDRDLLRAHCTDLQLLTHRGRDKMAPKFLTTFSNAFSWMKIYKFRLRFHWSLFPRVQLTIFHHWFR